METFSITHIGRRREMNQDYVFASETAVGQLPNLFLVADGMGGHKAGEYASRFTVEKIVEELSASQQTKPVAAIRDALVTANRLLIREAKEDSAKSGMGTTVVAATIIGTHLHVANVGDSRLYVTDHEAIRQITRDHSLVEEMVRLGEMNKAEAKDHPDKNIITRAIGVTTDLIVDFFEVELKPGDTVLMCSDGLTYMVDDEEIRAIIAEKNNVKEKAERLIETANEHGGKDNITVVLVEPFSEEVKEC